MTRPRFTGYPCTDLFDLCRAAELNGRASGAAGAPVLRNPFHALPDRRGRFCHRLFRARVCRLAHPDDGVRRAASAQAGSGLEPVTADANRPKDWPGHLSHGRRVDRAADRDARQGRHHGRGAGRGKPRTGLAGRPGRCLLHPCPGVRPPAPDGRHGDARRLCRQTGHPYTGIARLLVKRGEGTPEDFTMAGTRTWLERHPEERDRALQEKPLLHLLSRSHRTSDPTKARSGRRPALCAGRSLAVDPSHIPYGALVHVGRNSTIRRSGRQSCSG